MSASSSPHPQQPQRSRRTQRHRSTSDPLPKSASGQKLTELFLPRGKGWDWIYTSAPEPGESPQWETIGQFPLTPIEMESLHGDPNCIVGIRPTSQTRWLIIDIDKDSLYHPTINPHWLPKIQTMLESIGICRTLLCQSSHSGGLHLYLPLPQPTSSFWLSVCIKLNLEALGIKLTGGQCELYPNPKKYIPKGKGFSLFAGIRLPMQPGTGFYPLDADLNPLPWTLSQWLHAFEQSASQQDYSQLEKAISHSEEVFKLRKYHQPRSLGTWQARNAAEKRQGWTGPGQTNEKLKVFACEARVFQGMDSVEQIASYVEETARSAPGFNEYSAHVSDIKQRSVEIARWALKFYWPNGTTPLRETGYHSTPVADFSYHSTKRAAASHRIEKAVAQLTEEHRLPTGVKDRVKAIVAIAHVSQQTLYKAHNKRLWHPDHYQPETASKAPEPQSEQEVTQHQPKNGGRGASQLLKLFLYIGITQLLIQVGFVIGQHQISAATALALKGQRAGQAALELQDLDEGGEFEGGNLDSQAEVAHIENWQQLQLSLPERFQRKVQRVKSQLRSPKVVQLPLPLGLERETVADRESGPVGEVCDRGGDPLPVQPELPVVGLSVDGGQLLRSLTEQEEREFSAWFDLATQVGVVTDSEWQDGEYWVEAFDGWHPYAEMAATFSLSSLGMMLAGREGDEDM